MDYLLIAAPALAAARAATAPADPPFPLPGQPCPDLGQRPQRTGACVRSAERQAAASEGAPIGRLGFPGSDLIRCSDTV